MITAGTNPSSAFGGARELSVNIERRACNAMREILRNTHTHSRASGHKAKVAFYCAEFEDCNYLIAASNATPFESLNEILENGCTPYKTGQGPGSIRGSGICCSGYVLSPNGNFHVIVASRTTKDGFRAGKGYVKGNLWNHQEVTKEIEPFLCQKLGKKFDEFNVFVMFPYPQTEGSVTSGKVMNTLAYACGNLLTEEFASLDVEYGSNGLVLGRNKKTTYETVDDAYRQQCRQFGHSLFEKLFRERVFEFQVKNVEFSDDVEDRKTKITFDAHVRLHCFPGYVANLECGNKRLVPLDKSGSPLGFSDIPNDRLYFRVPGLCDVGPVEYREIYKRLKNDAVYQNKTVYEFMPLLGLPAVGIQCVSETDTTLPSTKRYPFVILEVSLTRLASVIDNGKEVLKQYELEGIAPFIGGILLDNFCFQNTSKCRSIISKVLEKCRDQITQEVRDYFSKLFPPNFADVIKLDKTEVPFVKNKCKLIDATTNKRLTDLACGGQYIVMVESPTGEAIVDFEYNVSRGFEWTQLGDKKWALQVSHLRERDAIDSKVFRPINAKQYKFNGLCEPQRTLRIKWNGTSHDLAEVKEVPLKAHDGHPGPGQNNGETKEKFTDNRLISMGDPDIWGDMTEDGRLVLNQDKPEVRLLFVDTARCFRKGDSWYMRCVALIREAERVASGASITLQNIDYRGLIGKETSAKFDNARRYAVHNALKCFFEQTWVVEETSKIVSKMHELDPDPVAEKVKNAA